MPLLSQVDLKVSDWVGKVSISHHEITSFYVFSPLCNGFKYMKIRILYLLSPFIRK